MKKITKTALINETVLKTGYRKEEVKAVINCFIDLMNRDIKDGKTINLRKLGTFYVKEYEYKNNLNHKNLENTFTESLESMKRICFKPSRDLKENSRKQN